MRSTLLLGRGDHLAGIGTAIGADGVSVVLLVAVPALNKLRRDQALMGPTLPAASLGNPAFWESHNVLSLITYKYSTSAIRHRLPRSAASRVFYV
jgi:hypothetical protein